MSTRPRTIGLLLILITVITATSVFGARPADFGKQWVRNHPFAIMALTMQSHQFSPSQYNSAGLNTFLAWKRFDELLPKAVAGRLPWHAHIRYDTLSTEVQDLVADSYNSYPGNTGWLVNDEPTYLDMAGTADVVNWIKQNYPDSLVYTNAFPWGAPGSEYYGTTPPGGSYSWGDYLDDIIAIIQPDVLCYDYYPFSYGDEGYGSHYFFMLMTIRSRALNADIPYWAFIQSYQRTDTSTKRLPSESDLRMQLFTMLAAGYKGFLYFTYDGAFDMDLLAHDGTQTETFYSAMDANPEVVNLGQALRFLRSTDIRFIPGRTSIGNPNPIPLGLSSWSPGAGNDTKISGVSVDFAEPDSEGENKDGLIGFFTEDSGEKYFMLTNVYQRGSKTAAECELSFVVQFDSSVNELLRLNRLTGQQEIITLTNNTLELTLPGGTGDLFKYNDANFVGIDAAETTIVTFKYGVNGYTDTEDGYVRSKSSSSGFNFGGNVAVSIDGDSTDTRIGLMQWRDLFGPDANQIPVGKAIQRAMLRLYYWLPIGTPNAQGVYVYPFLVDVPIGASNGSAQVGECSWDYRIHDTNGWGDGTVGTGPIAGTDYDTTITGVGYMPAGIAPDGGWVEIDVMDILNGWAGGSLDIDHGFLVSSLGTYGGYFHSSDHADTDMHPELVIEYEEPTCGTVLYPYPRGDLNQDCYVDFADFALVLQHWMDCTDPNAPCSYVP